MVESIKYIKSEKRITLSTWQSLEHYAFMLVPLMLPLFELFSKLSGKSISNTFSTTANAVFVAVSLIFGYMKWRELFYYEIKDSRSDKEFETAVLASANKLNWGIIFLHKNKFEGIGYNPWKSRDPQTIKIERQESKVLINSMVQPGFLSAPDLFGVNRKNRNTFLHFYCLSDRVENLNEKVIQKIKEEEEKVENEPEWTLKNTIKRIVAYIFSFGFWAIGIAIWKYEGFNFGVVLFGIIGSSYIIFDIYVMWTKRKKQAHNM